MVNEQFPGVDECIRRMKSGDASLEEDGFWWLDSTGEKYLGTYLDELNHSFGICRSFLIELIGNATSEKAISTLVELMNSGVKQDSEDAQLALWSMSNDIGKPFVLEYEAKSGEFAYYLKEGISEFRAKQ